MKRPFRALWISELLSGGAVIIEHMFEIDGRPGAAMAAALDGADATSLGEQDLRAYVRAADQMVSWAQGLQAQGVAEIARRTGESQTQRGLGLPTANFLDDPFRLSLTKSPPSYPSRTARPLIALASPPLCNHVH